MPIDFKESDRVYRVDEAAKRLGVTANTVTKWLRTGQLEGLKRGKTWYIREAALRDYVGADHGTTTTLET